MKLFVDLGNSRAKFAWCEKGQLRSAAIIDHADLSPRSLGNALRTEQSVSQVWISSVASESTTTELQQWLAEQFDGPCHRACVTKKACGVVNHYLDTAALGVDRWLAALGAAHLYPDSEVIIVDAGTAVTVDYLSVVGYQGGVILPGNRLMHESLTGNTAGIEAFAAPADRIIGRNTSECVNSGITYGLAGAVERVVEEMQKQTKAEAKLLITGGAAKSLTGQLLLAMESQPQLVLLGLAAVAEEHS
ncbi:MAG: type III pantothenate kinase [Gammaproteobacteria bacterium]|nr:type III pantothenate kinase [Gammaproteobacteria bacterium]